MADVIYTNLLDIPSNTKSVLEYNSIIGTQYVPHSNKQYRETCAENDMEPTCSWYRDRSGRWRRITNGPIWTDDEGYLVD